MFNTFFSTSLTLQVLTVTLTLMNVPLNPALTEVSVGIWSMPSSATASDPLLATTALFYPVILTHAMEETAPMTLTCCPMDFVVDAYPDSQVCY